MTSKISEIEAVRKMKYVLLDTINAAKTYGINTIWHFIEEKKLFHLTNNFIFSQQIACAFQEIHNNNNNNAISVLSVEPGRRLHYLGKIFHINKSMEIDDSIFLQPEIRVLMIIIQMGLSSKNSLEALEMNQNNFI